METQMIDVPEWSVTIELVNETELEVTIQKPENGRLLLIVDGTPDAEMWQGQFQPLIVNYAKDALFSMIFVDEMPLTGPTAIGNNPLIIVTELGVRITSR